jgi:hypothetical protein
MTLEMLPIPTCYDGRDGGRANAVCVSQSTQCHASFGVLPYRQHLLSRQNSSPVLATNMRSVASSAGAIPSVRDAIPEVEVGRPDTLPIVAVVADAASDRIGLHRDLVHQAMCARVPAFNSEATVPFVVLTDPFPAAVRNDVDFPPETFHVPLIPVCREHSYIISEV